MRSSLKGQNCPFVECVAIVFYFFWFFLLDCLPMCQYLPLEVIVAVAMVTVNEMKWNPLLKGQICTNLSFLHVSMHCFPISEQRREVELPNLVTDYNWCTLILWQSGPHSECQSGVTPVEDGLSFWMRISISQQRRGGAAKLGDWLKLMYLNLVT